MEVCIMTILLCCTPEQRKDLDKVFAKYDKLEIIESTCDELEESMPLFIHMPDATFYGHVTPDRVRDVIAGRADDLKIQTARLFDVSMETYKREPMHRRAVKLFRWHLDKIDECTTVNIAEELDDFCKKYELKKQDVVCAVKMALIGTTKGPALPELMTALHKKEAFARIDKYLADYKYRI